MSKDLFKPTLCANGEVTHSGLCMFTNYEFMVIKRHCHDLRLWNAKELFPKLSWLVEIKTLSVRSMYKIDRRGGVPKSFSRKEPILSKKVFKNE